MKGKIDVRQTEFKTRNLALEQRLQRRKKLVAAKNQLALALETWPKRDMYRPVLEMLYKSLCLFIDESSLRDIHV